MAHEIAVWAPSIMYIVVMAVGVIWIGYRMVLFGRQRRARKEAEQLWSNTLSGEDFEAFVRSLREKKKAAESDNLQV
jgi:hypothetical protein